MQGEEGAGKGCQLVAVCNRKECCKGAGRPAREQLSKLAPQSRCAGAVQDGMPRCAASSICSVLHLPIGKHPPPGNEGTSGCCAATVTRDLSTQPASVSASASSVKRLERCGMATRCRNAETVGPRPVTATYSLTLLPHAFASCARNASCPTTACECPTTVVVDGAAAAAAAAKAAAQQPALPAWVAACLRPERNG